MKQNTLKIYGTRKCKPYQKLKLGQLITLNCHVYQHIRYKLDFCRCTSCAFWSDDLWIESHIACKLCSPKGIFKLIK